MERRGETKCNDPKIFHVRAPFFALRLQSPVQMRNLRSCYLNLNKEHDVRSATICPQKGDGVRECEKQINVDGEVMEKRERRNK